MSQLRVRSRGTKPTPKDRINRVAATQSFSGLSHEGLALIHAVADAGCRHVPTSPEASASPARRKYSATRGGVLAW